MNHQKLDSPSFHRNVEPIISLFKELLKQASLKWLEIGSGSGQHIERLGREFPHFEFQPTDLEEDQMASISAWIKEAGVSNVRHPCLLDVTQGTWPFDPDDRFDVFSAFNVVHIAPWNVTQELFRLASNHGNDHCRLFLYGPFKIAGKHTSESNQKFEKWLKEKDKNFGVRDIAEVEDVAANNGFMPAIRHTMPANNFMMEFVRTAN